MSSAINYISNDPAATENFFVTNPAQLSPAPVTPTITFIPAPGSPWRVIQDEAPPARTDAPAASTSTLTFLQPPARQPARKQHRLLTHGGFARLETTPYGIGTRYTHTTSPAGDIEELAETLEEFSQHNSFAIRGTARPDAGLLINRRLKTGDAPDIRDTPSAVVAIDLDQEEAPDGLDTDDILAVGEYLRSRLPPECQDVSCVIQLSAGYGLWRWKAGPRLLKSRIWFLNDAPLSSAELRRWFNAQNATGNYAQMDAAVASANQPIYTAAPTFEGMPDPVPQRLALLLGEAGDTLSLTIPEAVRPAYSAVQPPPDGESARRDPTVLRPLTAAVRRAIDGTKHATLNTAGFTAGGYVAGGAISLEEAREALQAAIREHQTVESFDAADSTIEQALLAGMMKPLYAPPEIEAGVYPQPDPPPASATFTVEQAQETLRAATRDLLANPRHTDGTPRIMLQIAPPGLGKTSLLVEALIETGKHALILSPTHALAEQSADWINHNPDAGAGLLPYRAKNIRGRLAPDPTAGDGFGVTMCMRPAEIKALRRAGAPAAEFTALCQNRKAGSQELTTCPHIKECGYMKQMKNLPQAVTATHPFLHMTDPMVLADHTPDIVVVDESIARSLIHGASWTIGAVLAEGGIAAEIASALAQGQPLQDAIATLTGKEAGTDEERRTALLARLEAWRETLPSDTAPAVYPGQPEVANLSAIARYTEKRDPRLALYGFARALRNAIEHGHRNALWFVPERRVGETVFAAALHAKWKPLLPERDAPILILDATARPEWYRAALGRDDLEVIETPLPPPPVNVIQVFDTSLPQNKLLKPAWQTRLIAFANSQPGSVGLITHRAVIEAVKDRLAPHVKTGWFNALEGLDHLKHCDVLIVAGRIEPPAWALEADARALWPDRDLKLGVDLIAGEAHYTMRDGTTRPATVRMHPDPHVNLLLAMQRDDGLAQAVGRLRTVHGRTDRTLILLTNVPVPGIAVDTLTTIDALLPSERAARLLLKTDGVLPLGKAWLTENQPGEFSTEKAVKEWVAYERKRAENPNKVSLLGNSALFPALPYRLAGQRGQATTALVYGRYSPAEIEAHLAAHHGKTATLHAAPATADSAPDWQAAHAPGNLTAALGQPFVATHEADPPPIPDPIPIAPPAPAVAPTITTGEVVMKKPGNIEFVLGCAFDPDWEQPEITRAIVWVVTMTDGRTATLRIPENPDIIEATQIAKRMIPSTHHVALPRQWA